MLIATYSTSRTDVVVVVFVIVVATTAATAATAAAAFLLLPSTCCHTTTITTAGSTNLAHLALGSLAIFAVVYSCLLVYGHHNNEPREWRPL